MKQTIDLYQFRRAFEFQGRADNFSYEGQKLLFDYLEQLEDDTGETIELDIIALCCGYSEDTFAEVASSYSLDVTDYRGEALDGDALRDRVLDYLANNTSVCGTTDTRVVYQSF